MRATTLRQEPAPLLVGERVNSQGSRKVKRLLLADDYEGILDVAREQAESGAHVLDVCVALTERADEAEQMSKVVKLLSMSVEAPLMIDSTEAPVIEAALEHVPGRAIINSINMENGRKRIDAVVPLAKKHGAALVALTIDEVGMAKTRERKLEVARAIYDIVVGEYGLAARGPDLRRPHVHARHRRAGVDRLANETIEGIRLIKRELPGRLHDPRRLERELRARDPDARACSTRCSCITASQAGLDMAIVNPAHITPYAEIPRRRARAGRRPGVQPPARRAAAVHRALRRSAAGREDAERREGRSDGRHDAGADACTGWSCTARRRGSRTRSTPPACASSPCAC